MSSFIQRSFNFSSLFKQTINHSMLRSNLYFSNYNKQSNNKKSNNKQSQYNNQYNKKNKKQSNNDTKYILRKHPELNWTKEDNIFHDCKSIEYAFKGSINSTETLRLITYYNKCLTLNYKEKLKN